MNTMYEYIQNKQHFGGVVERGIMDRGRGNVDSGG